VNPVLQTAGNVCHPPKQSCHPGITGCPSSDALSDDVLGVGWLELNVAGSDRNFRAAARMASMHAAVFWRMVAQSGHAK
jgi:hypothetical protein